MVEEVFLSAATQQTSDIYLHEVGRDIKHDVDAEKQDTNMIAISAIQITHTKIVV